MSRVLCTLLLTFGLAGASSVAGPVEDMIAFVTVGDPGNPDEDGFSLRLDPESDLENSGVGYVAEEFEIGMTEATNEMYVRFLNAVAADDKLYGLYTTLMATDPLGGIVRSGSNGSYTYRLKDPSAARKPVNFVSSFDAMRFINWLHNGMPGDPQALDQTKRAPLSGPQGPDSTEDGAYSLVAKNPRDIVRRNLQARYFLPDVDEFHKAAYYDPNPGGNRPSQSYWPLANQSTNRQSGNFGDGLIDVGTGAYGPSYYGTYDQDGNVAEWTDSLITSSVRAIAGRGDGAVLKPKAYESLAQAGGGLDSRDALEETSRLGFRVAKPAPRTFQPPAFQPVLVLVDGAGNADDSRLRPGALDTVPTAKKSLGAVNYIYKIGAYETTNEEYSRFLNSVASRSDPYGLYDSRMAISKVRQSDGTFRYAPSDPEAPRQPVVYVSLFSAMRFCNWLHNGATAGGDTETGAYRLLGNLPSSSLVVTRSAGARFFIPGEDEWYKAAFYSKNLASYSSYATQKNTASPAEINYFSRGLNQARGFIETGDLGVSSWYGTYDQSGNAEEWTETLESDLTRYTRGGSYQGFADEDFETEFLPEFSVSWRGHSYAPPEMKLPYLGFRIAAAEDVQSGSFDPDTDRDGIPNGWEEFYGLNPSDPADAALDGDKDGKDGLTNLEEYLQRNGVYGLSTNPTQRDSDSDGLTDGAEVKTYGTNPLRADTDGDSLTDKAELESSPATDPLKRDSDGDGLADNVELLTFKTNPLVANDRPFFVPVGDPENPDDDGEAAGDLQNAGRGYVAQEFDMAVTEVTNWMYAQFLNSVAKRDRLYGLYKTDMGDSAEGGIIRRGAQGSYTYEAKPGFEGKPVNFVSLWDALRYINWLHNWKVRDPQMRDAYRPTLTGAEDQNAATTEDGVYALRGTNPENFTRHPAAQFFLPDVDEWHKAAYYDPDPGNGRPAESYWDWATQKMNPPTNEGLAAFTPTLVPVGTASGDYAGPSHYGTFDQDGNVAEWVQDALILGGRKTSTATRTSEIATLGFRVAQPVAGAIVTQETVPLAVEVGQPGNLADEEFSPEFGDDPIGAVGYTFQMGAYEATNREYTKFLNAKAKEDSFYRLYDTRMGSDAVNGGIERSGANGNYTYKVKTGFATKPVVYVSIYSAMRYCNWLHNGGRADSDMESGAYRLLGNIPTNTANLTRNATARYYLPNATEFYKAAYYDPSSLANATFDYWKFATRSDTFDTNNNASNLANVDFSSMASYFGTYGQSGNVGYQKPGATLKAPSSADTGEWLEEADNSGAELATRTFRVAAAAGMPALRPLGDEDSDGMSNAYEVFNDLDPRVNDASEDPDKDGLTNLQEFRAGTEARNKDTDGDGMDDGWEVQYGLNPRVNDASQDPDQDGLTNLQEYQAKTDPKDSDTDNDGMGDGWEVQYGFDPKNPGDAEGDPDLDGLSNLKEFQAKTDPKDADTDNDGLSDGNEVTTRGTNPLNPDTDGDTLTDGDEVNRYGTDPLKLDTDGDGFADNIELQQLGTNPKVADNEPFFVRVGDPGNPDDDVSDQDVNNLSDLENDGMGHVGQAFDMGMTEVTNLMYAKFLNAVAKSDSLYGLYSTLMGTESTGGIIRQGSSGNYRYVVKPGYEGRPVNFVSALDAMRYCNWLHNGSPATGVQNASTTEDGAYPLRGKNQLPGIKVEERERVRRSFGAKYFLPDEDEWHKAAYYDPDPSAGRPTDSYWPFADQTTSGPGGNFSDVRNRPVASSSGRSHYGTFDQDGNVGEWTEGTIINGTKLSVKNGSAGYQAGQLTLHIDILADKFWLTGQTQGVFGASQRRAVWATFPPATSADPQSQTTNVGMVGDQTKVATLDNGLTILTAEIGSTVWPNGGFRFALKASGPGLTTIRGAGKSAAIDIKGVDAGATLSFREGLDLSAVFEAGDSSFGPLTVKSSDIDDPEVIGESDASEPLPAESERRDVGFRIARAVTPPPVTQALLPRMVAVGSPRNEPDLEGKGAVDYEFQIGAYEVTNAEYAAFLNAVAADDSVYRLYDIRMGTGLLGGIDRLGSPGTYTYAAKTGFANKPVNYVTFFNALRYCNWLHNGAQPQGNTEFGAYRLLGGLPFSTGSIRRNFGARYFLPNEDEWHKAAYYDPSSDAASVGNYWDYAIRSQSPRFGQIVTASLTGLAEVSKPGIASYFATYGQNGNAAEWVENISDGDAGDVAERLVLGGGLNSDWASPDEAVSFFADPTKGVIDRGFRIAARVEAPSTRAVAIQTIKFTKLPAKRVLGTKPLKIRLRATATSKLKPEFVVDDPGGIATYVDGKVPYLLVTKPGTLKITARQPGLGRWAAAEDVQQTIEIVPRVK